VLEVAFFLYASISSPVCLILFPDVRPQGEVCLRGAVAGHLQILRLGSRTPPWCLTLDSDVLLSVFFFSLENPYSPSRFFLESYSVLAPRENIMSLSLSFLLCRKPISPIHPDFGTNLPLLVLHLPIDK